MFEFTEAQIKDLVTDMQNAASDDLAIARDAQYKFAKAIEQPLRKVLLSGDIVNGIFTPEVYGLGRPPEYMLDLLVPGDEANFYAYVKPSHGAIPHRLVEADYLMVPTYEITNSIDCKLRVLRNANTQIIGRMMEIYEAGFIKKMNDDGWQVLMAAGLDRNILINDANATAGQFTPRLIHLMKTFMRRNGGGNSATLNRAKLTDVYVSPEALDDIRSWNLDLIPDAVRTNIFYSNDNGNELVKIHDVTIHDLDELGEGQEYQNYYTGTLGGSMASADVELVVGLDCQRNDSFVMPVVQTLQSFEDNTLHRRGLFGIYGWQEQGFGVLDTRRVLLGSL